MQKHSGSPQKSNSKPKILQRNNLTLKKNNAE